MTENVNMSSTVASFAVAKFGVAPYRSISQPFLATPKVNVHIEGRDILPYLKSSFATRNNFR